MGESGCRRASGESKRGISRHDNGAEQECAELKAEVVEQGERNCFNPSCKLQGLMDHPAIAGILTEILSEPPFHGDGSFDDTKGGDGRR